MNNEMRRVVLFLVFVLAIIIIFMAVRSNKNQATLENRLGQENIIDSNESNVSSSELTTTESRASNNFDTSSRDEFFKESKEKLTNLKDRIDSFNSNVQETNRDALNRVSLEVDQLDHELERVKLSAQGNWRDFSADFNTRLRRLEESIRDIGSS